MSILLLGSQLLSPQPECKRPVSLFRLDVLGIEVSLRGEPAPLRVILIAMSRSGFSFAFLAFFFRRRWCHAQSPPSWIYSD